MFTRLRPDMLDACVWFSLTSSGSGRGFQRPSMARMVRVRNMPHLWFVSFPRWNSPISKVENASPLSHFTLPYFEFTIFLFGHTFPNFGCPSLTTTFCLFHSVFCFLLFHPYSYSGKLNSPLSVSPSCSSLLVFTSFSPPPSPPPSLLLPLTWAWGTMMVNRWLFWCLWSYIHQTKYGTTLVSATQQNMITLQWCDMKPNGWPMT